MTAPRVGTEELQALLLDTTGWDQGRLRGQGERIYRRSYCAKAETAAGILTHDGHRVRFSRQQFHHAFKRSKDFRGAPHLKDTYCPDRVARIGWIDRILAGAVRGTVCTHSMGTTRRPPRIARAYFLTDPGYVVRLWQAPGAKPVEWWFETAYPTTSGYIRKCLDTGFEIGRW